MWWGVTGAREVAPRRDVRAGAGAQAWDTALGFQVGPLLSIDILEYQPSSLGATSLQSLIPRDCTKQISTEAICTPDAQHWDHNLRLATSPQASELHQPSFTKGSSCTPLFITVGETQTLQISF